LGDEKRPLYDLVAKNLGMAAEEESLRIPASVAAPGRLALNASQMNLRSPAAGFTIFICEVHLKHKRRTLRQAKEGGYTCAWCLTIIPERHEHFGFGAKAAPDVDLSEVEGKWIDIQLVSVGKTVRVGVTTPDSPARREHGYHFYFVACSEHCCKELRDAVREDVELERDVGLNL
jgi:hypothetical protein